MSTPIKFNIVSETTNAVSIILTSSPIIEDFVYRGGYKILASSAGPEYTGDILYVWGSSNFNADIIEIPTTDWEKVLCTITEYNQSVGHTTTHDFSQCCGHLWINLSDCACRKGTCHICGATHTIDDMRVVTYNDVNYRICMTHRKNVTCWLCNEKHYFLIKHKDHSNVEVCASCASIHIPMERQLNYSYKPEPIFYDVSTTGQVITQTLQQITTHKGNKFKFYMGHEVEQQLNDKIPKEALIGQMKAKLGDLIYCKSDGSIGHGTECVTYPTTWEFFKSQNWEGILSNAIKDWRGSGYEVGHHVHISKDAFDRLHLFRFLKFHHTHKNWVEFISQRKFGSYCKPTGGAMTKALNKRGRDKYEFINITATTVEWRAFASPTTLAEFKKNGEYIYAAFLWTKLRCKSALTVEAFERFIYSKPDMFPNLINYLDTNKTHADYTKRIIMNEEPSYSIFTQSELRIQQRYQNRAEHYTCVDCAEEVTGTPQYNHNDEALCPSCHANYIAILQEDSFTPGVEVDEYLETAEEYYSDEPEYDDD